MSGSMIERVAQAIYAVEDNKVKFPGSTWQKMTLEDDEEDIQWLYREYARAALEAMREPTDAMLDAAEIGDHEWRLAIDAALSEPNQ